MRKFVSYLIAIFLIGIGAMLVLDNVGVIEFGFGLYFYYIYPVVFLVIGLRWLFEYLIKRGEHWFLGLFFTVFGTLLLFDRFGIITFYFKDVIKLWPLLIIYIGFMIIGYNRQSRSFFSKVCWDDLQNKKWNQFSVGSHQFSKPNWKVEPTTIETLAGDFYFDFTKAFIPEEETPIHIHALAGDVHILLPETVDFRLDAKVKAGDIDIAGNNTGGINKSQSYITENYESAMRKIDIVIYLTAGSIRVDLV